MRETTLTLQRNGATYTGLDSRPATGILAQIDQVSDQERVVLQQVYHFYGSISFKIHTLFWNAAALLKQDDILIDERFTDPDTGAAYRYKVIMRPKDYPFDHQECLADVTVGT